MRTPFYILAMFVVLATVSMASAGEVNVAAMDYGGSIKGFWQQKIEGEWQDKGPMNWSNPYLTMSMLGCVIDGTLAGEMYFDNSPRDDSEKRYCFEITLAAPSELSRVMILTLGAEGMSDSVRHTKSLWVQALVAGKWQDVVGTEKAPVTAEGKDYVNLGFRLKNKVKATKARVWLYGRNTEIILKGKTVISSACPRVSEIMIFGRPDNPVKPLNRGIVGRTDGSYELDLNGMWMIRPYAEKDPVDTPPKGSWGAIMIPGTWTNKKSVTPGVGKIWKKPITGARRVWLARLINVPFGWKGRKFSLSVEGLTSAAQVYVKNKKAGEIEGPDGALDLSEMLESGRYVYISLLIYAGDKPYAFQGKAPGGAAPKSAGIKGRIALVAK